MFYRVGTQDLGQINVQGVQIIPSVTSQEPWQFQIYHMSGGIKKLWYRNSADDPISDIQFELNEKGCGAGKITFNYLNFPLDPNDYILIYYQGNLVYRGIFNTICDPKGGDCLLINSKQLLDGALWRSNNSAYYNPIGQPGSSNLSYGSTTYTNVTMYNILKDIITSLQNPSYILLNQTL